ncbi:hypothetical protein [Botrimarina sp.]|uniref:hypothetical protein n=1 Tax=Botrimarina sp. TaxID=2795802 RepID=UPI0032EC8E50
MATRPERGPQLVWLPSGWLAVVLVLTLAAQGWGAPPTADGWRPRGSAANAQRSAGPSGVIRQVGYEDDIAGPALRTAGRIRHDQYSDHGYRVAQQPQSDPLEDGLREEFAQPFGVDTPDPTDAADELFDDQPAAAPQETLPPGGSLRQPEDLFDDEPADDSPPRIEAPAQSPEPPARGSLFDDEQPFDDEPFDDRPADDQGDLADDLSRPFAGQAGRTREESQRLAVESCQQSLADLKASRLSDIDLSIELTGQPGEDYPFNCTLDDGTVFAPRVWCDITYHWKASGLCHKPLYFEDVHLERYGHSWGPYVQPLVSGAHFFGRLPVLPYMMGLQTPDECVYTLGHYRPGDCAPYLIDPIPFTWRAALFQAGATVGVAGILP